MTAKTYIEILDGPIGSYDVVGVVPDTPAGRRRVREYLGVRRLRWHVAYDDDGLVAVAVRPGADPDDARPMACRVVRDE